MKHPKFHIFQGKDGQWYWHLKAANGRVIAQGEGYASKRNVVRGVCAVLRAFAAVIVNNQEIEVHND